MKYSLVFLFSLLVTGIQAQELFPYSEPASNMPAHSISIRHGVMLERGVHTGTKILQRHTPEIMFGVNRKWMLHAAASFSDMHQESFIFESARVYAKYRFLSEDGVHRHFRMAAFAAGSYSRNHLDHNELNLMGDQTGVQAGLIATQLLNRVAFSATGSVIEILNKDRWNKIFPQPYSWRALNYSLSAGYLLFPVVYRNYDQTNVNLYAELLGSRNLEWPSEKFFIDLAPSVQLIFKSTGKLNLGYRFQLTGDIYRLAEKSFMISYEHIFLNALRRKKK